MTGSNFVFPPPPPPPPVANQSNSSPQSQSLHSWRGTHGNRWPSRGRGRGGNFRGTGGAHKAHFRERYSDISSYRQPAVNTTHKRPYAEAFSPDRKATARTAVAPAVPSFGSPIPLPTAVTSIQAGSGVIKRKTNQLGLTPASEDYESSSEDDANEEARLGESLNASGNKELLQFSYKGQLSSLNSPAEIAAWIKERKKRYPTKARVEEAAARKAKEREESKARKAQSSRNSRHIQGEGTDRPVRKGERLHEAQQQKAMSHERSDEKRKDKDTGCQASVQDDTTKARLKALKLQKKLEKAQKQLAALEAKNSAPQMQSLPKETTRVNKPSTTAVADTLHTRSEAQLLETQQPGKLRSSVLSSVEQLDHDTKTIQDELILSSENDSDTSSELTDTGNETSEDETSSSGSSDSDSGSAPLEMSSKDNLSQPIPKLSKAKPNVTCKHFRTKGHCRNGKNCRFLHETQDKGATSAKGRGRQEKKSSRSSLYQRLLARQQEDEDEKVLRYIVQLGESGLLDEPDNTSAGGKLNVKPP